jgi:hypothetical protein
MVEVQLVDDHPPSSSFLDDEEEVPSCLGEAVVALPACWVVEASSSSYQDEEEASSYLDVEEEASFVVWVASYSVVTSHPEEMEGGTLDWAVVPLFQICQG